VNGGVVAPDRYLHLFFVSGGRSSANPVPTARSQNLVSRILFFPFMTVKKLVLECWPVSESERVLNLRIYSFQRTGQQPVEADGSFAFTLFLLLAGKKRARSARSLTGALARLLVSGKSQLRNYLCWV